MINQHQEFIQSSAAELLLESAALMSPISEGIMMLKTHDYILQTLFMKMTGYLEQKMKCICWEIASESFEYRVAVYQKERILGFSTYKDKKAVLNDLLKEIRHVDKEYIIDNDRKRNLIEETKGVLAEFVKAGSLRRIFQEQIENLNKFLSALRPDCLLCNSGSKEGKILEIFCGQQNDSGLIIENGKKRLLVNLQLAYNEIVYNHRNRCAHNTLCYQRNNPPIDLLSRTDYCYYSYFVRFAILLLIDKIFVLVYGDWHDKCCHVYLK